MLAMLCFVHPDNAGCSSGRPIKRSKPWCRKYYAAFSGAYYVVRMTRNRRTNGCRIISTGGSKRDGIRQLPIRMSRFTVPKWLDANCAEYYIAVSHGEYHLASRPVPLLP